RDPRLQTQHQHSKSCVPPVEGIQGQEWQQGNSAEMAEDLAGAPRADLLGRSGEMLQTAGQQKGIQQAGRTERRNCVSVDNETSSARRWGARALGGGMLWRSNTPHSRSKVRFFPSIYGG